MEKSNKTLSHWLLASDIDGTINNKGRQLVKRNYDAIHKWEKEKVHHKIQHLRMALSNV